jgi:uncharacterized protein YgiM (DUF1202 family)
MAFGRFVVRGKTQVASAVLGIGVVAGSLLGATGAVAAPRTGAHGLSAKHYACWCKTKVTTTNLNLRQGPGTNYDVLYIMPEGLKVQADLSPDMHQNGFVHVSWKDGENYGWASEQYLADVGTPSPGYPITGSAVITDRVNFRQGPGYDYYVQEVLDTGTEVDISDEIVDGFRYVQYDGADGWIYNGYLDVTGGGSNSQQTMTTTSRLNLRAGATLDADVLLVMPEGATVSASDLVVNGFRNVLYGGYEGWAHDEYLQ